jgi:hypothetical protein
MVEARCISRSLGVYGSGRLEMAATNNIGTLLDTLGTHLINAAERGRRGRNASAKRWTGAQFPPGELPANLTSLSLVIRVVVLQKLLSGGIPRG